jgi:3-deoxy-7-phosphoheptulonate synthase
MSFTYLNKIPTADQILAEMPLPEDLKQVKKERDAEIRRIFERKSDKLLLIIGPCSAHDEDAVCEYISRLSKLQEEVADTLVLVPRIYTNKPRTTGVGYKGMAHQPDLHKKPNIVEGIKAIRRMHIRALKEGHLTAADEMLYPNNLPYIEDLLSYVAVGARSVENQQHRLVISGMDGPAGMKNPTSGDVDVMLNAIYAAQQSHTFIYNHWEVTTSGNPLSHAVLRGAVTPQGRSVANYHFEDLHHVAESYQKRDLANPAIIVDTNHSNSAKQWQDQPRIGMEVMHSRKSSKLLKDMIRGLMVESFLVEGSQPVDGETFGQSITDPCLGWNDTVFFVKRLAETV